jgi:hypothetical protein
METEKRAALRGKREALQAEIAARERLRGIRRTLDHLEATGVPHRLVHDEGYRLFSAFAEGFPSRSYSVLEIDWERVPGAVRGPWSGPPPGDEVRAWLDRLAEEGRIGEGEVLAFTDNGHDPMIRLPMAAVRRDPMILDLDGAVWWVWNREEGWAIEHRGGDHWWWGRRPEREVEE